MSIPKILYKYLDIEGAKKTLCGKTLKYSSPNSLNDPFECLPGCFYDNTTENRNRYLGPCSLETDNAYKDKLSESGNYKFILDKISKKFTIASFSASKDNLLMWAHYAEQHKGVVLGFDSNYIGQVNNLLPVEYNNKRCGFYLYPNDWKKNCDAMYKLMTTKSPEWSYENEWRRIENIDKLSNSEALTKPFCREALVEIIIGCKAHDNFIRDIKDLSREYTNAKLLQAEINQSDFKLDIVECK